MLGINVDVFEVGGVVFVVCLELVLVLFFFVGYVWEIFKCVFVIVFDFVGVEVEVVGGIFVWGYFWEVCLGVVFNEWVLFEVFVCVVVYDDISYDFYVVGMGGVYYVDKFLFWVKVSFNCFFLVVFVEVEEVVWVVVYWISFFYVFVGWWNLDGGDFSFVLFWYFVFDCIL